MHTTVGMADRASAMRTRDLAPAPGLSVVVPCFDEEEVVGTLIERLSAACRSVVGDSFEILLVNDGSKDGTWRVIRDICAREKQVFGISLSRNFGHQIAISAGLQMARGDRVLIIDADLQDPPEVLPDMMRLMDEGADVVYGQRIARDSETWMKRSTASLFYRLLRRMVDVEIPPDTGDFRLMKKPVVEALLAMDEQHRFIRGMVAWLGFRQVAYPYIRKPRAAGQSHYSLHMMIRLAIDAITGFSIAPLRWGIYLGLLFAMGGVASVGYALYSWLLRDVVPGWSSTVILMSMFSSVQLIILGIIGEYIGRMFVEVKRRPHFIIAEIATPESER